MTVGIEISDFGFGDAPPAAAVNSKSLRDVRTPRDWRRPWRDPPGFLLPSCPCCPGGAQMYSLGGQDGSTGAIVATADKTNMSAETTAAVTTANLTVVRDGTGAAGNPSVAGYSSGGRSDRFVSDQTLTDKVTFSNDTTAAAGTAALSQARYEVAGLSERSSKAYFAGGLTGSGGKVQTTDKLTFSGDATSAVSTANLSLARAAASGISEGTTKGYWGGGVSSGSITPTNVTDKITFASDATAALTTANLSVARFRMVAGSDGSTKGYFAGGQTGSGLSDTDTLTFSTDTTSGGPSFNADSGASGSDGNKLFGMGGSIGSGGLKITFATNVVSGVGTGFAGNLSESRLVLSGMSTVGL